MLSRILPQIVSVLHARLIFGRRVQALADNISEMIPDGVATLLDVGCGVAAPAARIAIVAVDRSFSLSAPGAFDRARQLARTAVEDAGSARVMVGFCRSPIVRTMLSCWWTSFTMQRNQLY